MDLRALLPLVSPVIRPAIVSILDRLEALERQVKALEQRLQERAP